MGLAGLIHRIFWRIVRGDRFLTTDELELEIDRSILIRNMRKQNLVGGLHRFYSDRRH